MNDVAATVQTTYFNYYLHSYNNHGGEKVALEIKENLGVAGPINSMEKSNYYQDTQHCISDTDTWHTNLLFTVTIKSQNSAFLIFKTTKPISTKLIYFLPYIYTTSYQY